MSVAVSYLRVFCRQVSILVSHNYSYKHVHNWGILGILVAVSYLRVFCRQVSILVSHNYSYKHVHNWGILGILVAVSYLRVFCRQVSLWDTPTIEVSFNYVHICTNMYIFVLVQRMCLPHVYVHICTHLWMCLPHVSVHICTYLWWMCLAHVSLCEKYISDMTLSIIHDVSVTSSKSRCLRCILM